MCIFVVGAMHLCLGERPHFLSVDEKLVLIQSFAKENYPSRNTIRNLAEVLGLSEQRVILWFAHKRETEKRKRIKLSPESK